MTCDELARRLLAYGAFSHGMSFQRLCREIVIFEGHARLVEARRVVLEPSSDTTVLAEQASRNWLLLEAILNLFFACILPLSEVVPCKIPILVHISTI